MLEGEESPRTHTPAISSTLGCCFIARLKAPHNRRKDEARRHCPAQSSSMEGDVREDGSLIFSVSNPCAQRGLRLRGDGQQVDSGGVDDCLAR